GVCEHKRGKIMACYELESARFKKLRESLMAGPSTTTADYTAVAVPPSTTSAAIDNQPTPSLLQLVPIVAQKAASPPSPSPSHSPSPALEPKSRAAAPAAAAPTHDATPQEHKSTPYSPPPPIAPHPQPHPIRHAPTHAAEQPPPLGHYRLKASVADWGEGETGYYASPLTQWDTAFWERRGAEWVVTCKQPAEDVGCCVRAARGVARGVRSAYAHVFMIANG
ncbi:unnamed protein product, partial [Vitrella brassicaformis CCMP3155]